MVKNLPANAGDAREAGSIRGSGRFPRVRKWQPRPVFLPGEFHGQRSLAGYSPQGCKESDTTERLSTRAIKLAFTRMQNALIFTCCVIYFQRT